MQLDILLLTPRWWSLWNKWKYWQKYHVVSHAMQTHAFKLSWCTSCTLLRNPCPKIHAPTPLWCIACDTLHVALKLLLLWVSTGILTAACDALAEEAVVWICTCVSGLQILLLSSYVIAARLLLRNRSLIALLKIRTEQEFKKTPQIFALLLRAWGTVFYEFARNWLFFFS